MFRKYISALRQCAKEHKKDITPTFQIRVSDLCEDTARLLEDEVVGRAEFEELKNKLDRIEQIIKATEYIENGITYSYCYNQERKVKEIKEVLESED